MFPFDLDDDEVNVTVDEETEPSDYEIDFTTGKLTGRIITGLAAIEQWIKLTLSTDRYYFTQYSWSHGSELHELIGKTYTQDYIEAEVKRMVTDALSTNSDIQEVTSIDCTIDGDTLTADITVKTIYGEGEVIVNV